VYGTTHHVLKRIAVPNEAMLSEVKKEVDIMVCNPRPESGGASLMTYSVFSKAIRILFISSTLPGIGPLMEYTKSLF
jgi:hypothetical protein